MSEKKTIYEEKGRKNLEDVISFLRITANCLEQGSFVLKQDDKTIELSMPKEIKIEIKLDEKTKKEGIRYALELELEWTASTELQDRTQHQAQANTSALR